MPSPQHGTGKTSEWREDLNYLRRHDPGKYQEEIDRVKQIYARKQTVRDTADALKVGKRTFERAMLDFPELRKAIDSVRAGLGR